MCWGLGFYLARKTMFIEGLGSLSGKTLKTALDTDKMLLFELPMAITFYP